MKKIRIAIHGIEGKMGKELVRLAGTSSFSSRLELVTVTPDVWIEFSSPQGALELLESISKLAMKPKAVIGSTGWSKTQLEKLEEFAKQVPVLKSANFSLGVQLCRMALSVWGALPSITHWTIRIREWHHTEKKDSPSGTALSLRDALGQEVPISSVREGNIVGTHEVTFESDTETLTLTHVAKDRSGFAVGALEAAISLAERTSSENRVLSLDDLYLRRKV